MKKIVFMLILGILFLGCEKTEDKKIKIGILQIVEHVALDDARQGIIDALDSSIYKNKIQIDYKNAQGDFSTAQIISKELNEKVDIIVPISTASAQATVNNIKKKPIFFSEVANPEKIGILHKNVTGVSNKLPIDKHVALIKKLLPQTKKIGIVYNTSEENSFYSAQEFENIATKQGYQVIIKGITKLDELNQALDVLLPKIDVLYTNNDNIIASSYSVVVNKCNLNNKPIIASSKTFVNQGALACEDISDYEVGYKTGELIVKYLNGSPIEKIPYEKIENSKFYINEEIAKKFNISTTL